MTRLRDLAWVIERRRPDARGYRERSTYVGVPKDKPKGWRIVRALGQAMGTPDGAGLC